MATPTINAAMILNNPGILYFAPAGTAEPSQTVASSVFSTAAWGGAWVQLGPTDNGTEFGDNPTSEDIEVEESYWPVKRVVTKREATVAFALAHFTATNLSTVTNGAGIAVTGSGATQLNTVTPVAIGAEVRGMIGWQSQDDSVRFIAYQALQLGEVKPAMRKGANKALLACTWKLELGPAGYAYRMFFAGTTRA